MAQQNIGVGHCFKCFDLNEADCGGHGKKYWQARDALSSWCAYHLFRSVLPQHRPPVLPTEPVHAQGGQTIVVAVVVVVHQQVTPG